MTFVVPMNLERLRITKSNRRDLSPQSEFRELCCKALILSRLAWDQGRPPCGRDAAFVGRRRPFRRCQAVPLVAAPALLPALTAGSGTLQLQRVTALRHCGNARAPSAACNSPGELSFGRRHKSGFGVVDLTVANPSERSIVRANEGDL